MCKTFFFRLNAVLVSVLVVILAPAIAKATGRLHTEGLYFKDAQGRTVLLRGLDVSNEGKVPPFNPLPDLSVIPKMRAWGINSVRLAFIWEAFEPERDQFNFAYLEKLRLIIDTAGENGISTVLDFHADAFSRFSIGGCGSGFPKWTLPPDVLPENPDNGKRCALWPVKAEVADLNPFSDYHKTLKAFYSDRYGARSRFLQTWATLAHFFRNNINVIGYDIINEPWAEEKKELSQLYEDAAKIIRREDPQVILLIEPNTLVTLGWPSSIAKPTFKNFAYAPHNYDPLAIGLKTWFTGGLFTDNILQAASSIANRLNAPLYVGEFGARGAGRGMRKLIEHYYTLFDQSFVSTSQWNISTWSATKNDGWDLEDMSIVDAAGKLRDNFIVRPYPMAVAGKPGEIRENYPAKGEDKYLSFSWQNQPELGSTEFFIPKETLGGQPFSVSFRSPDLALHCQFDRLKFTLACMAPTSGEKRIDILIHKATYAK